MGIQAVGSRHHSECREATRLAPSHQWSGLHSVACQNAKRSSTASLGSRGRGNATGRGEAQQAPSAHFVNDPLGTKALLKQDGASNV